MFINPNYVLKLTTSAAVTVDVVVGYLDIGMNREQKPGSVVTLISTATTTDICTAPTNTFTGRQVESISIRNRDASPCDVTLKLFDGVSSTAEVYKVTLAAGAHAFYERNSAGWTVTPSTTLGVGVLLTTAADVVNSDADTLANVTGLSFDVTSGQVYRFRAVIPYTSAATTTGSRWTINGPSMTHISYTSRYTLTASTETFGYYTALQQPAAANATSLTTGNVAVVEGFFKPSASGTAAIQFASEVGASAITALAGATLEYVRTA